MIRTDTVLGAVAGAAAGYILWLLAFSIADDNSAVGRWAPTVLLLSAVLAVIGLLWGSVLRRRRKFLWSGFGFGLPILPVALTLAVLADVYL
jgi:ABC-type transport system involved in multi-copper enzyme maturation permease subunit